MKTPYQTDASAVYEACACRTSETGNAESKGALHLAYLDKAFDQVKAAPNLLCTQAMLVVAMPQYRNTAFVKRLIFLRIISVADFAEGYCVRFADVLRPDI